MVSTDTAVVGHLVEIKFSPPYLAFLIASDGAGDLGCFITIWQGWQFRLAAWPFLVWVELGSQLCFLWYLAGVEELFLSCLAAYFLFTGLRISLFCLFGLCLLTFPAAGFFSFKLGYMRQKENSGIHHCVVLQVSSPLAGLVYPLYLSVFSFSYTYKQRF